MLHEEKHVKTHSGKLWKCTHKNCKFEAIDKCYPRQHSNTHTTNNYVRKYCKQGFTYYMQRKRHYEKDH